MSIHNLKPLSEVISDLKNQGYTNDFYFKNNKLHSMQSKKSYDVNEVTVIEEYRFEGNTNPSDMSLLYVIECNDGEKGTLTKAYGAADVNTALEDFMKSVRYRV